MAIHQAFGCSVQVDFDVDLPLATQIPACVVEQRSLEPPASRPILRLPRDQASPVWFEMRQTPEGVWLSVASVGRFALTPTAINYDPIPGAAAERVREEIFGLAFTLWLEVFSRTNVLHGGAVEVDGAAVVFLGEKGRGKSTTTLAAVASGAKLLTDDQVIVRRDASRPLVTPALPWINAWPDALSAVGLNPEGFPAVRPGTPKRRLVALESLSSAPIPLRTVYLLKRAPELSTPEVRQIPRAAAIAWIAASSPTPRALAAIGRMGERLRGIAEMMLDIEILELAVPNDVRHARSIGEFVFRRAELESEVPLR